MQLQAGWLLGQAAEHDLTSIAAGCSQVLASFTWCCVRQPV